MSYSRLARMVLLSGALFAVPRPGHAEGDPRLAAIEAQIRSLEAELARVKRDLRASNASLASTQRAARAPAPVPAAPAPAPAQTPAPAPAPPSAVAETVAAASKSTGGLGFVSFPSNRPTITSGDGRLSAAVGLQLHFDVGGYFQGSPNGTDTRAVPRLNTFGENLRRARLPFVFKYDEFQINLTPDFGGSPDGTPTLYEASINWTPTKALTATLGYFKPWLTLGDSTSSNDFLFLERPAIVEASRNIAAGDARAAAGLRWTGDRVFAAAYLTGAPYGSQTTAVAQPQQTGATLRLAARPVATEDWDVHAGFSASDAFHIQRTATGQTLTVQDRPELRIDTNRLVSTGSLNARSAYTYGPEFAIRWRNLMLQGEYIRIGVDRTDGGAALPSPGLQFSGGYVEASWVITGEPRPYLPAGGAFTNPKPAHPVGQGGGPGAFELVGRYSHIDLNDRVTRGTAATRTGGVYGGSQDVYAVGLNWYPNDILRLMLDYDIIAVDRLNAAGTTQTGQRIQAVALRAQAAF